MPESRFFQNVDMKGNPDSSKIKNVLSQDGRQFNTDGYIQRTRTATHNKNSLTVCLSDYYETSFDSNKLKDADSKNKTQMFQQNLAGKKLGSWAKNENLTPEQLLDSKPNLSASFKTYLNYNGFMSQYLPFQQQS